MGAYSPTGPFNEASPPPIDIGFLNNIETWIGKVDSTTPVTVSGSSGTASLYQFLQGSVKGFLVFWSGYKTSSPQNLVLPVAFTTFGMFQIAESQGGNILFKLSGATVSCSVQNIMSSSGGTENAATPTNWTNGQTRSGFDTLNLTFASGTAATGGMVCFGL